MSPAFHKARKLGGKLAVLALLPFLLLMGVISAVSGGAGAAGAAACQVAASSSSGTFVSGPVAAGAGVPAVATQLLDPSQVAFANALVTQTHINGTLVVAWLMAEQGGKGAGPVASYLNGAIFYPGRANDIGEPFYDWLNIGIPSVSGAEGVTNTQWNNATTAGTYTGQWLQGTWNDPPWGDASASIQAFAKDAPNESVAAQIRQLQQSGWAASGYPALTTDYQTVVNAESTSTGQASAANDLVQTSGAGTAVQDVAFQNTDATDDAVIATTGSAATTTTTSTAATISKTAANAYLTKLDNDPEVGYAVIGPNGQVLASHKDTLTVNDSGITEAMLLVAYLQQHPTGTLSANADTELSAMIENSSSTAGNWTYQQVGEAAVYKVATDAGMSSFKLNSTGSAKYVLADSTVDAIDLAKFFQNIEQLIPAAQRSYAMNLLDNITNAQQWGILNAGITGVTATKGGWGKQAGGSWTVNQASQVTNTQWGTVGIAIVSQNDGTGQGGLNEGEQIASNVSGDLIGTASVDQSGYGISLSSLTAAQQDEVQQAATQVQDQDPSACSNVSQTSSLPTVSGPSAQIGTDGTAATPTGLPPNVQAVINALIAAGNQINALPYIWGGGHGVNLNQIQAGYDCSGSTSYMLYKAGLLASPYALVAADYKNWGDSGPGKYITVFSNSTHVFIEVAGIVMDTAWYSVVGPLHPSSGPRWQPATMIQAQINGDEADGGGGFIETHPPGL